MHEFFLKLNANKTKILVIRPASLSRVICIKGTFIDGTCIRFVDSAKNLGIILDEELSFSKQVTKLVKSCYFTIRDLSRIKPFLTLQQLQTSVCACVFSKIDYCNALYFAIGENLLDKLQSVQNSAARLLKKKCGRYNVSTREYIRKYHWLRVRERIIFKMCLHMHKGMHHRNSPDWLQNLIAYNVSERMLKLEQLPFKSSYGKRSFTRTGPRLWNLLPAKVKDHTDTVKFKNALKTFLFDGSDRLVKKLYES